MTERYRSPNGAEWTVVDAGAQSESVTLELALLPDGSPATLQNRQTFAAAELEAGDGWESLDDANRADAPPAPDRIPEGERIARRERAKREGGRARKRRLGLRRDR